MTTNTNTKLANAYVQHHQEALELLEQIQEKLMAMPAPDGETAIHWGHVGTMEETAQQLRRMADFLG